MDGKKNMLKRYTRQNGTKPYPPLQKPSTVPQDAPEAVQKPVVDELPKLVKRLKAYRAVERFKSGESTDRFRIIDADGNIDFYSYNHLVEGSYRDEVFTLVMSTRSYVFTGRNLDQLIDLVAENKVRALYAFIDGEHEPVTDPGAVVIEGIARE